MSGNKNLHRANKAKNDEFYTQLSDIEKELKHYKHHFEDKVVFCNCDDPEWSNFWRYFELNFEHLKLKKLIATHYNKGESSYKLELFKIDGGNDSLELKKVKTPLLQDGDFRSEECIELLKESDIVVTNPPFSLFREYVSQLMEYEKKFVIIGNENAITYKEIFRYLKNNHLWIGNNSGYMEFEVPIDSDSTLSDFKIKENGKAYRGLGNICWFTNLDFEKRHEELILYKTYNEKEYLTYCNYDAINVNKKKEIPLDYDGVMGVPISFLEVYNPEQFEIIGLGIVGSCEFSSNRKMEILDKNGEPTGKFTYNAKGTLYTKFNPEINKKPAAFRDAETGELYSSIYARVLIRKKKEGYDED